MRRLSSVVAIAAVAVGVQVAMALPSHAETSVGVSSGTLSIIADAVDAQGRPINNNITIDGDAGEVTIADAGDTLTAGRQCQRQTTGVVRCSGIINSIQVILKEGDDVVTNRSSVFVRVNGGPGGDTLNAGSGGSRFRGGPGDDTLTGGAGADILEAESNADGRDALTGNGGVDGVDYSARASSVTVTLDDNANDGAAGEQDNIRADVENIVGGREADSLSGNSRANEIRGGRGGDTINGQSGPDVLIGGGGEDTIFGGAGDDQLSALDGLAGERVDGGANTDTCTTDAGDTRISCER